MAERTEWQQFRDDHPEIGDEQAFFLWYEVKGGGVAHEYWLRAKQKRIGKLATMPYAEYLKTPEWKQRRRRAVMRAKRKCQLCGAQDQVLHVHHNTYDNRGAEPACDLIVLCAPCHEWYHNKQDEDEYKPVMGAAAMSRATMQTHKTTIAEAVWPACPG